MRREVLKRVGGRVARGKGRSEGRVGKGPGRERKREIREGEEEIREERGMRVCTDNTFSHTSLKMEYLFSHRHSGAMSCRKCSLSDTT